MYSSTYNNKAPTNPAEEAPMNVTAFVTIYHNEDRNAAGRARIKARILARRAARA